MKAARKIISTEERTFGDEEIIVSKTDLRGVITYVNEVFVRVSRYREHELLGAPHNLIRHPAMPRCVFKVLWDTIQRREEVFAYVLNLAKDGVGYWVFAHVTPSFDAAGQHIGYHSNRRSPYKDALLAVKPLYRRLLEEEQKHTNPRAAAEAGHALLQSILAEKGQDYGEFVFSLSRQTSLQASV